MKIIVSHVNQDFDSLASVVAAKKLFPDAVPVYPGAIEKNARNFLNDFPEIIDYTKVRDIEEEKIETVILLDSRQPHRTILNKLDYSGSKIIIFDHHPHHKNDIKGDEEVVKYWGATITILLQDLIEKNINLSPEEATLFALGIFEDTGMLTYPSLTLHDMKALEYLLEHGANFTIIRNYISYELNPDQARIYHQLLDSFEVYNFSGVSMIIGDAESNNYVDGISILTHKLMDLGNHKVGFIITQMKERVHVIGRSRIAGVNVSKICEKFGGGGHPSAASAVVKDRSKLQVKEALIEELKRISNNLLNAAEIMEKDVVTVSKNTKIDSAYKILKENNKNIILVTDNNEIAGYLTRDDLKKADAHRLNRKNIMEIISFNFDIIGPNTKIYSIYKKIFSENNILIVRFKNNIRGIITKRTIKPFVPHEFTRDPIRVFTKKYHYSITSNAGKFLKKYLPPELFCLLKKIAHISDQNGFNAYLVGGFVRDLLLAILKKRHDKVRRFDFDIVSTIDGIKFAKTIAKKLGAKVRTHRKFNTALLIFPKDSVLKGQEFRIDVATARKEKYKHPGALPTVSASTLRKDLFRRDFTINTIALNLSENNFGKVVDFFGGQNDMKRGLVRVLHNLSFIDDPTRIFRGIRFSGRLNFRIEEHTEHLLKNAIKSHYIKNISGKRIFEELKYIFDERNPVPMIKKLAEYKALYFLSPEIRFDENMEELVLATFKVISWYNLLFAEKTIKTWIPYLLSLIYYVSPEEKRRICKEFYITKKDGYIITRVKNNVPKLLNKLNRSQKIVPSKVYDILHNSSIEILLFIMAFAKDNLLIEKKISLYLIELINEKPFLTGKELLKMGFKPGPGIGRVKKRLLYQKLDGKVQSKDDEIKYVNRYILKKKSKK